MVSATTEGIEICHGYRLDDLRRFAGYAMHNTYWQRAMSVKDRYEIALSAIAEYLCQSEYRPEQEELVKAGRTAIKHDVQARLRSEGIDSRTSSDQPNMPRFHAYWWLVAANTGSHETHIVEVTAMLQIWPRLTQAHQDTLTALAIHGTYDKAAVSLGKTLRAFETRLHTARKQFLRLWHEGEQPSRIWGHDFFGIDGYDRKENITSITLGQRKRRARQKKSDNGNG
jgi:hypothetical protein